MGTVPLRSVPHSSPRGCQRPACKPLGHHVRAARSQFSSVRQWALVCLGIPGFPIPGAGGADLKSDMLWAGGESATSASSIAQRVAPNHKTSPNPGSTPAPSWTLSPLTVRQGAVRRPPSRLCFPEYYLQRKAIRNPGFQENPIAV